MTTVKITGLPYGNETTYNRNNSGCFDCSIKSGIDGSICRNLYPATQQEIDRDVRYHLNYTSNKVNIDGMAVN
jgi:hypothetical protein